jgi:hypothetical protein
MDIHILDNIKKELDRTIFSEEDIKNIIFFDEFSWTLKHKYPTDKQIKEMEDVYYPAMGRGSLWVGERLFSYSSDDEYKLKQNDFSNPKNIRFALTWTMKEEPKEEHKNDSLFSTTYGYAYPFIGTLDSNGNQHFFIGKKFYKERINAMQPMYYQLNHDDNYFTEKTPSGAIKPRWSKEIQVNDEIYQALVAHNVDYMDTLNSLMAKIYNEVHTPDMDKRVYDYSTFGK